MLKTTLSTVILALLATAPAVAQNLLTNGTFGHDVAGWRDCSGGDSLSWSTQDADGASTSGSLQITYSGSRTGVCVNQCVPVIPGVEYALSAKGFIPSGQSPSLTGTVYVSWYKNAGCRDYVAEDNLPYRSTVDTWFAGRIVAQAPAGAAYAAIEPQVNDDSHTPGVPIVDRWDDITFGPVATNCDVDATHLCLESSRFRASVQWTDPNSGVTHDGFAVPYSEKTGLFYFFDADNIELTVKILDACPSFGHYWVFISGSTNVGLTVTITDTKTNQTEHYTSPPKMLLQPITDFSTFGCS